MAQRILPGLGIFTGLTIAPARCAGQRWVGWAAAIAVVRLCATRWRQRRALDDLDNLLLRDIGVCSGEARREARLPFWPP